MGKLKKEKGTVFEKALLLCKVAAGTQYETLKNMDTITAPPVGYHSVHGKASSGGRNATLRGYWFTH